MAQKVATEVLKDIEVRVRQGRIKYGVFLETENGRDALQDLYEELIDAVMYIKQVMMERDGKRT